jgi:hypothetical protein
MNGTNVECELREQARWRTRGIDANAADGERLIGNEFAAPDAIPPCNAVSVEPAAFPCA